MQGIIHGILSKAGLQQGTTPVSQIIYHVPPDTQRRIASVNPWAAGFPHRPVNLFPAGILGRSRPCRSRIHRQSWRHRRWHGQWSGVIHDRKNHNRSIL